MSDWLFRAWHLIYASIQIFGWCITHSCFKDDIFIHSWCQTFFCPASFAIKEALPLCIVIGCYSKPLLCCNVCVCILSCCHPGVYLSPAQLQHGREGHPQLWHRQVSYLRHLLTSHILTTQNRSTANQMGLSGGGAYMRSCNHLIKCIHRVEILCWIHFGWLVQLWLQ